MYQQYADLQVYVELTIFYTPIFLEQNVYQAQHAWFGHEPQDFVRDGQHLCCYIEEYEE